MPFHGWTAYDNRMANKLSVLELVAREMLSAERLQRRPEPETVVGEPEGALSRYVRLYQAHWRQVGHPATALCRWYRMATMITMHALQS